MPHLSCILTLALLAQAPTAPTGHDANPIFRELVGAGLKVGDTTVRLLEPTLPDGQDAQAGLAAIKAVAGDDRAAREFLRDSIAAPFILKLRDVTAGETVIRVADLWFVVHARLEDVDPERAIRQSDNQPVEAGNMRFGSKLLDADDLRERNVSLLPPLEGRKEWFASISGRLLDRIQFEATDRTVATRTADSLLIAARTDPAFERDARHPNRWTTLARKGNAEVEGPAQVYVGGASYAKITRLPSEPGALFVEAHFAFAEPHGWFQGSPILRSKIGLIAQDQIRRLRREVQKAQDRK